MNIVAYEPSFAAGIAACFNRITAGLHHCYPTTAERIESIFAEREVDRLRDGCGWVVRAEGRLVGFAHVAHDPVGEDEKGPVGAIRFLGYDRGHRAAGQALLETAEAHLRGKGVTEIVAFHQDFRWPCFHLDHSYCTGSLTHIEGLLGMNGFSRCAGEVYLDWPGLEPPEIPPCDDDLRIEPEMLSQDARLPNFVLRAFVGDERVGECWNASCGVSAPGAPAEEWALTTWLHMEESHRGKGLGAHLLAHTPRHMRDIGYRHAVISTSLTNYRAQLFYSNFGYRTSDWTYAWAKKPKEPDNA